MREKARGRIADEKYESSLAARNRRKRANEY